MPDDVPVQHLDAAGVEQVLLRVISQVIASCNSGDHDHLRRMERAQERDFRELADAGYYLL